MVVVASGRPSYQVGCRQHRKIDTSLKTELRTDVPAAGAVASRNPAGASALVMLSCTSFAWAGRKLQHASCQARRMPCTSCGTSSTLKSWGRCATGESPMLMTLVVVLIVMWLLGMVTTYTWRTAPYSARRRGHFAAGAGDSGTTDLARLTRPEPFSSAAVAENSGGRSLGSHSRPSSLACTTLAIQY